MMLSQILPALDHVHKQTPAIIHRDIKPANILYQGYNFLLTDFGIAKTVDTSRTVAGTRRYLAPEIWQNGEQTPKVDIYQLGVTVVECLAGLPSEAERQVTWQQWHQNLQTLLSQHRPHMAAMLADVADQRPTASQLLQQPFPQLTHASLQNPQINIIPYSFEALAQNRVNGTTMIYSTAPTPMDWTRAGATAFFQGNPWPPQQDESTQPSQPNLVAVRPPKVPPNLPAQPKIRRKGSVKTVRSVDERQKKSHKRGLPNERHKSSQFAGVPKRISSSRRSRSKSIQNAQERILGMA